MHYKLVLSFNFILPYKAETMNGLREQFEIQEHADAIRDQIAATPGEDVAELKKLLNEMHQVEEERRTSEHVAPEA